MDIRKKLFPKCLYHSFDKPLVVESAHEQYYNDNILDLYNNVTHIGHSNKKVLETISKEFNQVNINTRYLNKNLEEYGLHLYQYLIHLPKKYKILFVNSGSEANDLALRIATIYRKNSKIISLKDSYHGTTYLCDKVSNLYSTGVEKSEYDDNIIFLDRNSKDIDKHFNEDVSCVIMETIQGVAGNYPLSQEFVDNIFTNANKHNIITICDEVQTGFGRTGHTFWSFDYYNVVPDIITCGKPIANGYPMGAIIIREDLSELLGNFYFNTFGGNSVACAVANTVLTEIENNNMMEHSKVLGTYIINRLNDIDGINNVTGRGLFIGFSVIMIEPKQLIERLKESNIIVGIGKNGRIRIKPPMVVTKENIDYFIDVLLARISNSINITS
jgi:ethanolamine-phosphate phospho-lyase